MFKPLITGFFVSLLTVNSSYGLNNEETKTPAEYSVNTFYALLVAEMAGQRQLFDLALGNYLLEG